jgi:hypothetical protein
VPFLGLGVVPAVKHYLRPVSDTPDEFASATRTASAQDEQAALQQLHQLFGIVDRWVTEDKQHGGLSVEPGSALARDDRETNPYHLSHAVIHGLAGALDHLDCLRTLIQTASSLHTFAPFTLNRAALEGAAVAVWLLAPANRDERIRRRLVLATQNARDVEGVTAAMGGTSSVTDRLDKIRDVARRRPNLDPDGIVGPPPGLGRIVGEAGADCAIGSELALTCWKACSGITHSRQWASIALLDREELDRLANVINVRLTASFSNVLSMTAVSIWLSTEARRLFGERGSAHISAG